MLSSAGLPVGSWQLAVQKIADISVERVPLPSIETTQVLGLRNLSRALTPETNV